MFTVKMMLLGDILGICIVMHFSPSFYKGVDCTTVIKPQNIIALAGDLVTLHCTSNGSKAWSLNEATNYFYRKKSLLQNVLSYISVNENDEGILNIKASTTAANSYFCVDTVSGEEARAELIVLADSRHCSRQSHNISAANVNCSVLPAGNWDEVTKCEQVKNVVTVTWDGVNANICSKQFEPTKRLLAEIKKRYFSNSSVGNNGYLTGDCRHLLLFAMVILRIWSWRCDSTLWFEQE